MGTNLSINPNALLLSLQVGIMDDRIKLAAIGGYGVGKTCVLQRFVDDRYPAFYARISRDFFTSNVVIDGTFKKLEIWDTPGYERFGPIPPLYYRRTLGFLLCYDVTDDNSFQNLRHWMAQIRQHASANVSIILIGTKCDVDPSVRMVTTQQGQALAEEFGIEFYETSARHNINIREAIHSLIVEIQKHSIETDHNQSDSNAVRVEEQPEQDKGRCC